MSDKWFPLNYGLTPEVSSDISKSCGVSNTLKICGYDIYKRIAERLFVIFNTKMRESPTCSFRTPVLAYGWFQKFNLVEMGPAPGRSELSKGMSE